MNIPRSLRFLCTINNDATVESLSNRFIDRAAIISLGYGEKSSPAELQAGLQSGAVPYAELMSSFSPQNNEEELEERESARLNAVLDLLKGAQINLSPRKMNAITKPKFEYKELTQTDSYVKKRRPDMYDKFKSCEDDRAKCIALMATFGFIFSFEIAKLRIGIYH